MVKLFRKIRRNLLFSGNTVKYVKYAVGEILLVVVGILIALQINNWNENRKKATVEISTLQELRDNLRADIQDAQADMRGYNIAVNSSDIIIDFIDGHLPYHDSLTIHLGKIPLQGVFTPNRAAYENLKISGIKLISNDTLRSAISNLYEGRYHYMEDYMEAEYLYDREKLGDFYLKEMQEYSFLKYAKPIDFKRLIGNQDFRNLIMHRKLKIQNWYKSQYALNIKNANQVIEMIDSEIEK